MTKQGGATPWKVIIALSIPVLLFVVWWIYGKEVAQGHDYPWVEHLPKVNTAFNILTSVFLICGYIQIKVKENSEVHKRLMIAAGISSTLFLFSYLTYHHFHGDTKFLAQGLVRYIYFFILISHIALSVVQVPLILATYYLGFTGSLSKHKKLARVTLPVWLYVSITGVLIFLFLKIANRP
jgi:putative membrane protein